MRPRNSLRQPVAASGLRTPLVVFTRTQWPRCPVFLIAVAGRLLGQAREELMGPSESLQSPRRGNAARVAWASASLPARALTCISLSLLAFSLAGGPLELPAGGEPGSRFLRGGLQMCRLLEQLGLSYPG